MNLYCKPYEDWLLAVKTYGRLFNHPLSTKIKRDMILYATFYRTWSISHSSVHWWCHSLGFPTSCEGGLDLTLLTLAGSPALCSPQSRSLNAPEFGRNFQGESQLWYSLTNQGVCSDCNFEIYRQLYLSSSLMYFLKILKSLTDILVVSIRKLFGRSEINLVVSLLLYECLCSFSIK